MAREKSVEQMKTVGGVYQRKIPFEKCQEQFGFEDRSSVSSAPKDAGKVVDMAWKVLNPIVEIETSFADK